MRAKVTQGPSRPSGLRSNTWILVIRSRRGPHSSGKDAGYEDVRHEMLLPVRGQEYHVQLSLKERPHPNVAFLEVIAEPAAGDPIVELLLGRQPELPRTSWGVDFDALSSGWARANASSRSAFRGTLRVDRNLADQPLYMHMNVIGGGGWKPAVPIGPLHLGERQRVKLPAR